ncbi:hypothetical protein SECTIM467_123 [Brevibacillus phage SecTim467]|uniref:DNA ligase n=2 Tax=Jenstvirus jenst TaxID=1982225 RepID=A0A0K2CP75_9CAUD|nr:putative ATP-dependent DNA ligase [Brevibacillus phage Jenst]ALA07247.1 putative ATP-dependent DNA ligase [Brevibacillus phage Jenst]ALA07571.1 hypothetical protein SECTIM467_123 [Brevibacillus phage SecTim467]
MSNYPLDEILLPMGGNAVKDEEKMDALWDNPNYVAEEKYDGSRYVSVGGRFFSRKLSVKTNFPVEKTENVPHLNFLKRYPLLILDGEVYRNGMTSNEVTKIMGATPRKACMRQGFGDMKHSDDKKKLFWRMWEEDEWAEVKKREMDDILAPTEPLDYVVFDILRDFDGNWLMDKPWKERRIILEQVVGQIKLDLIKYNSNFFDKIDVSRVVVYNKRDFYKEIMARDGEGVMLKHVNGTYHPDKKPAWNWVKVKKHITADVIITGFKPAKRDYKGDERATHQWWEGINGDIWQLSGEEEAERVGKEVGHPLAAVTKFYAMKWIGSIIFSQYNADGELVEVGDCSGISEELRKDMSINPSKYIGKVIEIGAMEVTKDGFYRHPQFSRFRDDKNAKDCIVGVD